MSQKRFVAASFWFLAACATLAQTSTPQAPPAPAPNTAIAAIPAANPADVSSPDAIIAATYDVISGPAGDRNWNRMRSLFHPSARLIRTAPEEGGGTTAKSFTLEEYITRAGAYFTKNGFFEKESARHTDQWGNILQAFSTYESRHDAKDATPFARGINSFQLFFDGHRWWVLTIYWHEESPNTPLPPQFLPHSK
jgi:hypothetical protein